MSASDIAFLVGAGGGLSIGAVMAWTFYGVGKVAGEQKARAEAKADADAAAEREWKRDVTTRLETLGRRLP